MLQNNFFVADWDIVELDGKTKNKPVCKIAE